MATDVLRVVPMTVLIGVVVFGLSLLTARVVGTGAWATEQEQADASARLHGEGVELLESGDHAGAREKLELALELRPESSRARGRLAALHIEAALEQIEILRGHGPEGAGELASLTAALTDAAVMADVAAPADGAVSADVTARESGDRVEPDPHGIID